MRKRENFFLTFFLFFFLSLLLIILSRIGLLSGVYSALEVLLAPVASFTRQITNSIPAVSNNSALEKLKKENSDLLAQLAEKKSLELEPQTPPGCPT